VEIQRLLKNKRKKFNEHDNHSRKTPVWKRRQVVNVRWNLRAFGPSNEQDNHSRKTPIQKCRRKVVKCSLDTHVGHSLTQHHALNALQTVNIAYRVQILAI